MARLVCEGVKVRVDDVWAGENNGKSFYVDIANFGDLMPKDGDEVTEEQLKQYRRPITITATQSGYFYCYPASLLSNSPVFPRLLKSVK